MWLHSVSMNATTKPQGRDEIRTEVIEAARTLVAERGPDGFSVRDVAARAEVNHALVHRHFGTKADVLEEVLAQESAGVVDAVAQWGDPGLATGTDPAAELLELLEGFPSYWRTLVSAVLDAPEAAVPGTAATTELFRALWRDTDPELATTSAVAGATALGWLIFGRFMSEATGADPDDVRREVAAQIARLTGRP
jgi:TetR/AcrR family transcriptional regulator, repressor for neighboring sulfatase